MILKVKSIRRCDAHVDYNRYNYMLELDFIEKDGYMYNETMQNEFINKLLNSKKSNIADLDLIKNRDGLNVLKKYVKCPRYTKCQIKSASKISDSIFLELDNIPLSIVDYFKDDDELFINIEFDIIDTGYLINKYSLYRGYTFISKIEMFTGIQIDEEKTLDDEREMVDISKVINDITSTANKEAEDLLDASYLYYIGYETLNSNEIVTVGYMEDNKDIISSLIINILSQYKISNIGSLELDEDLDYGIVIEKHLMRSIERNNKKIYNNVADVLDDLYIIRDDVVLDSELLFNYNIENISNCIVNNVRRNVISKEEQIDMDFVISLNIIELFAKLYEDLTSEEVKSCHLKM